MGELLEASIIIPNITEVVDVRDTRTLSISPVTAKSLEYGSQPEATQESI